ncbi:MAG: hypothetical protein U0136_22030 [Bdellovibrionota bacterium]
MTDQNLTQQNFLPSLVELVPELKPLYQEHITFYKEAVPGIFFASLARIVGDSARNLEGEHSPRLEVILEMIDRALSSSDDDLRESARTGFVDGISDGDIRTAIAAYNKPVLNQAMFQA